MSGSRIAFKEWAVICQALAQGRQALILRKGGIAEPSGEFRVEHSRFWLFPTHVHQQEEGIVEGYRPLLERVRAERPPEDMVRLSHFVEVAEVHRLETLDRALALEGLHGWSPGTVKARFEYRQAGLFVLVVRTYRATEATTLPMTSDYAGCKTWVELEEELPDVGEAVLTEEAMQGVRQRVRAIVGWDS